MFFNNEYITEDELVFYNFIDKLEDIKTDHNLNIHHHPDITSFKIVQRKHTNFINHFEKKKNNNLLEFPLHLIHLAKPKINIEKLDSFDLTKTTKNSDSTFYYIKMISSLLNVNDTESIKKIKMFNGDIYNTILFG